MSLIAASFADPCLATIISKVTINTSNGNNIIAEWLQVLAENSGARPLDGCFITGIVLVGRVASAIGNGVRHLRLCDAYSVTS